MIATIKKKVGSHYLFWHVVVDAKNEVLVQVGFGPAAAPAVSVPKMGSDEAVATAVSPLMPDAAPAADTADAVCSVGRKDIAVAIARTADKTARVLVVLFIVT